MQVVENDPWRNFLRGIIAKASMPVYTNSLHYFMRYLQFYETETNEEGETTIKYHPAKLLEGTDELLETQIEGFVESLKNLGRSRALIRTRVAAIKLFYERNRRKTIDWKRIISTIPRTKKKTDRAYSIQELIKAIAIAEPREKASILLLASSGMRVGALPDLSIGNLHPIEKYGIYKIVVYEGWDEEYFTFCTPEAKLAIDSYLDYRRRSGEKLSTKSPLFRRDFDPRANEKRPDAKILPVQPATDIGLRFAIGRVMLAAGVRTKVTLTEGQLASLVRHETKAVHGLRKFFDTQMSLSGVNLLWVEILEGHDIKLKESYFRPSESDLLEGNDRMRGYVDAIDYLTISEENRLRRERDDLKTKVDEIAQLKADFEKFKSSGGGASPARGG